MDFEPPPSPLSELDAATWYLPACSPSSPIRLFRDAAPNSTSDAPLERAYLSFAGRWSAQLVVRVHPPACVHLLRLHPVADSGRAGGAGGAVYFVSGKVLYHCLQN